VKISRRDAEFLILGLVLNFRKRTCYKCCMQK